MVRPMAIIHNTSETTLSSIIPLAIGLFVSATLLVALCAKHARLQVSRRKYTTSKTKDPNTAKAAAAALSLPIISPKAKQQLITTISNNKGMMVNTKKSSSGQEPPAPDANINYNNNNEEEESGVWQKAILMGERCQPPEFSGVIYYDYCGNKISEMPKSPRGGAMTMTMTMSPLRNFNFPVEKNQNSVH